MYVPPYESLLRALNTNKEAIDNNGTITLPAGLFKILLQISIGSSDFDEEAYLNANPDVSEAVNSGRIDGGLAHYIGFGFFEGRRGGIAFDEDWYLEEYPDIAMAVREGKIGSAETHFLAIGGGEARCPNANERASASGWKEALRLPASANRNAR